MAKHDKGLTGIFNNITFTGFLKFTVQAIFIGLIVGGIFDFTLFHEHPIGAALLDTFREPLLDSYDGIANLIGRPDLARPEEFIASPEIGGGLCSGIDPVTMLPVPCG